jgi:hypothetical protein
VAVIALLVWPDVLVFVHTLGNKGLTDGGMYFMWKFFEVLSG